MPQNNITIVIADGHLLSREGIKSLLNKSNNFQVLGEATESSELAALVNTMKPQVVIIDYHMPGAFTITDIETIYKEAPDTGVLVVTTNQKKEDILKVLEYGVNNYILKLCDEKEFLSAVTATASNEKFFCGKVIDAILDKHFSKNTHCEAINLSRREVEIVSLISQGNTNKNIASLLHLSVHTVSTHRKNILKKLGLNNSSELVSYSIQHGIISTDRK